MMTLLYVIIVFAFAIYWRKFLKPKLIITNCEKRMEHLYFFYKDNLILFETKEMDLQQIYFILNKKVLNYESGEIVLNIAKMKMKFSDLPELRRGCLELGWYLMNEIDELDEKYGKGSVDSIEFYKMLGEMRTNIYHLNESILPKQI